MFEENRRTKLFTLGAMCFSLFMVMLDNTVVNLALPTIQRELGSGISGLQWIVDAFILLLAALMLTGGALGDLYGRRRVFLAGLITFTLGSLFCALSPSVGVLIAGRAVQGLGAAVMMPSTLAILTNTFQDPRERAQAIGIWAGVSGIALAFGPAVGGLMVDAFGWQSIFYLNVPIGLVALAIALRLVPESRNPEGRGLDLPGQALAIGGLGTLTYAFIEANSHGWGSTLIITLFAVAVVALSAFGLWETRTKNPMLQLSFFKNITFTGANLVGLFVSFGFFGMIFFMALFMQNVQDFSPTGAGIRQLPSTLAVMTFSIISGRIVGRIGARVPITIGMVLVGGAILAFTTIQVTTPYSHYWFFLAILGTGTGLVMSPMTTAAMSTVPVFRAGMASATLNTTRQVGGVFGIAVLGALVTTRFTSLLRDAFSALNLPSYAVGQAVAAAQSGQGAEGIPTIPGLDVSAVELAVKESFTGGLHQALWVAGAVIIVGALVAAITIRGTSPAAQEARRVEEAAFGGAAGREGTAGGKGTPGAAGTMGAGDTERSSIVPAEEATKG